MHENNQNHHYRHLLREVNVRCSKYRKTERCRVFCNELIIFAPSLFAPGGWRPPLYFLPPKELIMFRCEYSKSPTALPFNKSDGSCIE